MNIFVLDSDPVTAARTMCDKHVVKMGLESVQMLSTIARRNDKQAPDSLYRQTHDNHPCTLWARRSTENWRWLVEHTSATFAEYTARYGKVHKSAHVLTAIISRYGNVPGFLDTAPGLTEHAQVMPDVYKVPGQPVLAYRRFYVGDKASFATWSHGANVPDWWPGR